MTRGRRAFQCRDKVICQGRKGINLPFSTILSHISILACGMKLSMMMLMHCECEEMDLMNRSEGHFQGRKGQVWLIFTYFGILISVIEVLPKSF